MKTQENASRHVESNEQKGECSHTLFRCPWLMYQETPNMTGIYRFDYIQTHLDKPKAVRDGQVST